MPKHGDFVAIGSTNPVKVGALSHVIEKYDEFFWVRGGPSRSGGMPVRLMSFAVASGVPEQPRGWDQIVTGARLRAERAAIESLNSDYVKENAMSLMMAFGIESGVVEIPGVGLMDVTCCAILDQGNRLFHYGFSGLWSIPTLVALKLRAEPTETLQSAWKAAGLTTKNEVGREEGAIGSLTKGKITREAYTVQAIEMAFAGWAGSR